MYHDSGYQCSRHGFGMRSNHPGPAIISTGCMARPGPGRQAAGPMSRGLRVALETAIRMSTLRSQLNQFAPPGPQRFGPRTSAPPAVYHSILRATVSPAKAARGRKSDQARVLSLEACYLSGASLDVSGWDPTCTVLDRPLGRSRNSTLTR